MIQYHNRGGLVLSAIKLVLTQIFNGIHQFVPDYGIDIILFTILLKVVLLPFNIIQTKSTVKTQMLQPKMKEVQAKYKNDPQKMQEAQMKLYKEEGVNPLGGCLPMLIQMPVLFAIFYVFREYPFGDASFLGLVLGKNLNSNPVILGVTFALLSGLTTYVSTWLLTPKNQDAGPMASKSTNLMMSAFFAWVSWTMSAGLVIYWIVNNILQMLIQYFLNKAISGKVEAAKER